MRTGIGFDAHRFASGRRLVLGGVEIPWDLGLAGHSDADVLCHAASDAMLGAVAAGDIGMHFPDTDPAWQDADSLDLLRRVRNIVERRGARVVNLDATVLAEAPKLGPYRVAMCEKLSSALQVAPDAVSVKASTMEGMGALGRGEGIAAMAVVLVEQDI